MVIEVLWQVENLGPACLQNDLADWNINRELLLYCGKVYISKDDALHTEIICIQTVTSHAQSRDRPLLQDVVRPQLDLPDFWTLLYARSSVLISC